MNLSNAWRPSGRRGKISSVETSSDRPQRAGSEFDQVLTNPQRNWTRRLRLGAGVAALGAVLAACSSDDQVFNTLDPKGENARQIDGLTMGIGWMATIVGIIVAALVVYVIIKFRATEETYDDLPEQVHGNTPAELGWTIAPAVLLLGVAIWSLPVIFDLNDQDENDMTVIVEGQQWWWQFEYDLDEDGVFETITSGDIVFPAGETINLEITSNDVIHSFWIPELNGKKDAVPGRVHPWKLQADEPGVFWGQCAEYCGLSHAEMRMRAVALSPEDWEEWKARQLSDGVVPAEGDTAERRGYELFGQFCASCHVVNGVYEGAAENEVPLLSGIAPNLTHLMGRTSFGGALFEMYNEDGSLNTAELTAWVRNAPGVKALAPDNQQGMISFEDQLDNTQLSDIIAYLSTLGESPILPD